MQQEFEAQRRSYYEFYFNQNAIYETWAKQHKLTSNTLFTLYVIFNFSGCCTLKLIQEKLLLPKQTINTILDVLEKKGLIVRKIMDVDRRNKQILLTDAGVLYADKLLLELASFESAAFEKMTAEEQKGMLENSHIFLMRLRQELEKDGQH